MGFIDFVGYAVPVVFNAVVSTAVIWLVSSPSPSSFSLPFTHHHANSVQGLAALEKILERAYQHHFQAAATSHDYDYYTNLRNQAIHEGDLTVCSTSIETFRIALTYATVKGKAFSESRQAYSSGDRAVAHSSSQEGKSHQAKRDQLNLEASQWIFAHNNKDCQSGTIDLHGLFVAEALRETESAIKVRHLSPLYFPSSYPQLNQPLWSTRLGLEVQKPTATTNNNWQRISFAPIDFET